MHYYETSVNVSPKKEYVPKARHTLLTEAHYLSTQTTPNFIPTHLRSPPPLLLLHISGTHMPGTVSMHASQEELSSASVSSSAVSGTRTLALRSV